MKLSERVEKLTGKEDRAALDMLCREIHNDDPQRPVNGTCRDYVRDMNAVIAFVPEGMAWVLHSRGEAHVFTSEDACDPAGTGLAKKPLFALLAAILRARGL